MSAISEFGLTDQEWSAIQPVLPTKWRGIPRVDDRRVLNGIFWVLRSGGSWRSLPKRYGPHSTCYNRYVRWRSKGIWDRVMAAIAEDRSADTPATANAPMRAAATP